MRLIRDGAVRTEGLAGVILRSSSLADVRDAPTLALGALLGHWTRRSSLFELIFAPPYVSSGLRSTPVTRPLHKTAPRFLSILTLSAACLAMTACKSSPERRAEAEKRIANAWTDADSDGIPDAAQMRSFEDRASFRRWFAGIAEAQFYETSGEWNENQRDCAGLVRFSLREALRTHDRPWFQRMGDRYDMIAPDVRAYALETNPLGEKIFRTRDGVFAESDLRDGTFSEFADAKTIKSYNCIFVSRSRERAKPGDLIFFFQPWSRNFPYHVMIFLGQARVAPEGHADWVVYHTGSPPGAEGVVKKVRLAVLDHHPDKRWRPVETNANYLGFFRLKILSEAQ